MNDFKLDFLCVGFNKCGTSSLHSVMKRIPDIQLPYDKKETLFFSWYQNYPDPIDMLQNRYFPDYGTGSKPHIYGAVEPSFIKHAEEVRKYFGGELKLVFMLRNPADAAWSLFKMRLRRIRRREYANLYRVANGEVEHMFWRYINRFVVMGKDSDFFYDHWLQLFLKYYPLEQMKFILLEDYVQDYQQQMKDLGQFLGFATDRVPKPRKQNTGNQISRNYLCAEINRILFRCSAEARKRGTNEEVFLNQRIIPLIQRYTLVDCPAEMTPRTRQYVQNYFRDSVRRTEELIGIPLEKRWFDSGQPVAPTGQDEKTS